MTHWRWEQCDETAFTHPPHGNRLGALTVWSHHSCLAGRRGHGLVPWAEREQGEGTEGREGIEGREGRHSPLTVKLLGTGVAGMKEWCGWLCVCVCAEWKSLENRSELQHTCPVAQSVLQVQQGQ